MSAAQPSTGTSLPAHPGALRRVIPDTSYLLSGLPLSIVSFSVLITGLSLSAGLLVTVIGLSVLSITILLARHFADLERIRITSVLGIPLVRPAYRSAAPDAGWWRRHLTRISDGQAWLDLAHAILAFPVTLITWVITVSWWAVSIAGIGRIAYDWAIPTADNEELPELLGLGQDATIRIGFYTLLGFAFLATLTPVIRGCAVAQASFSRALLSGIAEFQEKINNLEAEKATAQEQTETARARTVAAVSAEATALRRLERDIHDGPQQRLVRLAMDLGRAQHQLNGDNPQAAKETVTEAIAQTRETLDELRALSRGIAPPILVDRGLEAALMALAGRSTVPVDLATGEVGRLASSVESAAYFVVAEALTNVAKHSQATECRIRLQRTEDMMLVVISDNGIGGASLAKGHGLAGLENRVQAAGGRLTVASVAGVDSSGTVITAELPL